jgi:hypothetical protein
MRLSILDAELVREILHIGRNGVPNFPGFEINRLLRPMFRRSWDEGRPQAAAPGRSEIVIVRGDEADLRGLKHQSLRSAEVGLRCRLVGLRDFRA